MTITSQSPTTEPSNVYYLYILRCHDGSLYTGITNDLAKRMQTHAEGKGSKYVRSRLPFECIYTESHPDKASAARREAEIKGWDRAAKVEFLGL